MVSPNTDTASPPDERVEATGARRFTSRGDHTEDVASGHDEASLSRPSVALPWRLLAVTGVMVLCCGIGVVAAVSAQEPSDHMVAAQTQARDAAQRAERQAVVLQRMVETNAAGPAVSQAMYAAQQVVQLQNGSPRLAAQVQAAQSTDTAGVRSMARQMRPFFPDAHQQMLGPWFMAKDDATMDAGVGFGAAGSDSAVVWQVDSASTISGEGTVPVRFTAYERVSAGFDDPVVLAWATAQYVPAKGSFTDLRVGQTVAGQNMAVQVES